MIRTVQIVLGLVISVAALWLAMHDVRPAEVLGALRRANYVGFAALVVLTVTGFWLRAIRWRWLFSGERPIAHGPLFRATMIGFMANNLLPLRLGEFMRAWALGRREGLSKTTVFATVVVERVVDLIALIVVLGLALWVHPLAEGSEADRLVRRGATLLIAAGVSMTLGVIVLERWPDLAHGLIRWLTRPLPAGARERVAPMLDNFVEGLALFRDLPRVAWVFLLSFLMFGVIALGLSVSLWAFDIQTPWYAGMVMLVITAIGIMVPAAPGYIGTMNVACKVGLRLFGVGPELSVPFSWFYWAGQWLPVTLVGLYCLRLEGLSLASIGRAQDETVASNP